MIRELLFLVALVAIVIVPVLIYQWTRTRKVDDDWQKHL